MWNFFALTARMKYINRWSLMRNTRVENLSEHSLEVAMLAHSLALLGVIYLEQNYHPEQIALVALYHDFPEILTGDLPTPIKYYNSEITNAYKKVEEASISRLLNHLPKEMQSTYQSILTGGSLSPEEQKIVKAADKLSALIKCHEEEKSGNREFQDALRSTEESLLQMDLPEVTLFLKLFLPAYSNSLDQLTQEN